VKAAECRLLPLGAPQMQRRVGFVLKPCFIGPFFCLNSKLHLFVSSRGYFFAIIRYIDSFPSAYPSSRWSYSHFEQLPLHFRVRAFSEHEVYALGKGLFYIFVRQDLPLYSVGSPAPACLCRSWRLIRMQVADQQVEIGRQFCTPFDTNILIRTSQLKLCRNQWVTVDPYNIYIR